MPIGVHPTEMQLLLDLYFRRSLTDVADDWAAPHHPVTRNPGGAPGGPAWVDLPNGLTVLDFNPATPDFLESPAADTTDLDFTTEDFSLAAWIYVDDLSEEPIIMCRGLDDADGWLWFLDNDGIISFITFQAGAGQESVSAAGEVVLNTWYLVKVTRNGGAARIYKNGTDVTDTAGTHTNPLTSARKLHIGILDDETEAPFDGMMWRPRIWDRCLPASEMLAIFEMERNLFGV